MIVLIRRREQRNGRTTIIPIVFLIHDALTVQGNHVGACLGAEAPELDVG